MSTKKTLRFVVSGLEITRSDIVLEMSEFQQSSKQAPPSSHRTNSSKVPTYTKQSVRLVQCDPDPGPSGSCIQSDSDSDTSEEMSDNDKSCVCHHFQPRELKNCLSLVITKWAQCDHQDWGHWTHLIYCYTQRVHIEITVLGIWPLYVISTTYYVIVYMLLLRYWRGH